MRRVTVLVLACLALLVLSATGGAAERSLQTQSDDDLQSSVFAELSSESELEAEVEAEVDAEVESESEAADSATLAELDPEEHAKLQAVLASWPADQLVPLVGQQLSDDEPTALVEAQAESHATVAAQAEIEAAVEAEVDAELAAEAAAEAEADAAAESEVDAELILLEKAEAAALLFSSDAPVDINAQSANEVAPVMESRPQPHMVMVPAVSAAGPPSIRARADAAVEEQEDRALLALEAAVYANGCGSGWQSKVVPQWNMVPACNKHDNCYEDCKGSKVGCDNTMLADMKAICKSKYSKFTQKLTKVICDGQAVLYYQAVKRFGASAYANGMTKAGCPGKKA